MSSIPTKTHIGANVPLTLLALFVAVAPNALARHSKKPPDQPVAVIAHLALTGPPASQMLLQERDGKQYLYAVRNSGKGYTIVEVTNPSQPSLVKRVAWPDGASAGRFQTVGATLGIAEGSAANSSAMRPEPPPESLELVDLSDPANPRTIKSFSGADAQVAQLRFLEVGVNPDFVERANRHQVLADLDKVARIDVAPRDDAVDLRRDVAVTQIQFGLREIALGGFEFRLGLLDGRGIGRVPGERGVDVAQFIELIEHRFRTLVERVHDAELSGALNERRLRLEDGRKGLVKIGRHLAEIAAPVRLRREPERDADLVDFGQALGEVRAGRRQLRLPLVVAPHATYRLGDEFLRPIELKPAPTSARPCSC